MDDRLDRVQGALRLPWRAPGSEDCRSPHAPYRRVEL